MRAASLALALAGAVACGRFPSQGRDADTAIAARRETGLRALIDAAEKGRLVPFGAMVVVVRERVVQDALSASLPFERVIAGRYRVRVTSAGVRFEDGVALVILLGRATVDGRTEAEASVDLRVITTLDVLELDPVSGVLRGAPTVLAVDARRSSVLGVESRLAEALVEELGREGLEAFAALAARVEIPVALESRLVLPEVGPEGGVHIRAATLPIRAGVADVKAFGGRLWVSLDVAVENEDGAAP